MFNKLKKLISTKKKSLALILFLIAVALVFVVAFFSKPQERLSSFSIGDKASITVNTFPTGAAVILDGALYARKTPTKIDGLDAGDHSILVTLNGFYNESLTLSLQEKENQSVDITLSSIPTLVQTFSDRTVVSPQLLDVVGKTAPVLVYLNPVSRLIEFNNGSGAFVVGSGFIRDVNELSWFGTNKAVVGTGNRAADKQDFLINFDNWDTNRDPLISPMPTTGQYYNGSLDGDSVVYAGDINYDDGTVGLFTYKIGTNKVETVGAARFPSVSNVFWLANDSFLVLQESEESSYLTSAGEKTLTLVSKSSFGDTWTNTLLADAIATELVLSPTKKEVVYFSAGELTLFSLETGEKRSIGNIENFGGNLGYVFLDSKTLLIAHVTSDSQLTFTELDITQDVLRSAVAYSLPDQSQILGVERDALDRIIVYTNKADVFVFKNY